MVLSPKRFLQQKSNNNIESNTTMSQKQGKGEIDRLHELSLHSAQSSYSQDPSAQLANTIMPTLF